MAFFVYLAGSAEVTPDLHHTTGHHSAVISEGARLPLVNAPWRRWGILAWTTTIGSNFKTAILRRVPDSACSGELYHDRSGRWIASPSSIRSTALLIFPQRKA